MSIDIKHKTIKVLEKILREKSCGSGKKKMLDLITTHTSLQGKIDQLDLIQLKAFKRMKTQATE
jgi:hypothetical protein